MNFVAKLLFDYSECMVIVGMNHGYMRCLGIENDEIFGIPLWSNPSLITLLFSLLRDRGNYYFWYNRALQINIDGQILLRRLLYSQRQDWALICLGLSYGPLHYGWAGAKVIFDLIREIALQVMKEYGTENDLFDEGNFGFVITFTPNYHELAMNLSQRFNAAIEAKGFEPLGEHHLRMGFNVYDARNHSAKTIDEIADIMKQAAIMKQYEQDKKRGLAW